MSPAIQVSPARVVTPCLVRSTIVAALGGLLFGFDTAVLSGATHQLTAIFDLTPSLLGVTVASALWGTVLGAMFAGVPGDRFGRRDSLIGLAVLYFASALGCALAPDWGLLLAARALAGLAIGGSSVLGPLYIAEVAPARWRGRMVAFFQFNIVLGILLAYVSNFLIATGSFGPAEWRWKLGVAALPAALFFGLLFTIPRSSRWLAAHGRTADARRSLEAMGEVDIDGELRRMVESGADACRSDTLFARRYRKPIFLAVAVAMFNQLSGINAILYYADHIFEIAGFSKLSGGLQAVVIGFTNLCFTMLGMAFIDKVGRRRLLLTGAVGTCLCLAAVACLFGTPGHAGLLIVPLMLFIAFFALSQGVVIWVYIGEVFPTPVRAKGQSLGSLTHWVMTACISAVFPMFAATSPVVPFAFFSAMMAVQFVVVWFLFPETKGVALEEMQSRLGVS